MVKRWPLWNNRKCCWAMWTSRTSRAVRWTMKRKHFRTHIDGTMRPCPRQEFCRHFPYLASTVLYLDWWQRLRHQGWEFSILQQHCCSSLSAWDQCPRGTRGKCQITWCSRRTKKESRLPENNWTPFQNKSVWTITFFSTHAASIHLMDLFTSVEALHAWTEKVRLTMKIHWSVSPTWHTASAVVYSVLATQSSLASTANTNILASVWVNVIGHAIDFA